MQNKFTSRTGFVLTAIAAAVGLGNIWSFPRHLASGSGAVFIAMYIVLAIAVGAPLLCAEFALGRETSALPRSAMRSFSGSAVGGIICELAALVMLGFYCVLGGLFLRYMFLSLSAVFGKSLASGQALFLSQVSDVPCSVIFTLIFIAISAVILMLGVAKGLEKFSKFSVMLMAIMLPIIAICSLTLGNIGAIFALTKSPVSLDITEFFAIFIRALTQLLFSLSVGMGCMICYGAYLPKDVNIPRSVTAIIIADTAFALVSAVAVLPALAAMPNCEGAMLIFVAMQGIFEQYGAWGYFFGFLFYLQIVLTALTSAVSMMEVVSDMTSYVGGRKIALTLCAILVSIPSVAIARDAMGFGETAAIFGMNYLELAEFIAECVLMPIAVIIFVRAMKKAGGSILRRQLGMKMGGFCAFSLRYLALPAVLLLFLAQFIQL